MPARWFRISFAENAFRRYLAEVDLSLESLRIGAALNAATGFYTDARAQHARILDDGDGLLWQWGPDADAARFTAGITRQLIREGVDQPIVQVTLCLSYRWTPARRALGRGHTWCFTPAEVGEFERTIRRSPAFRAVAAAAPVEVTLRTDSL
ncbi:MAG TPA: hypothetical protein VNS80_05235 [Pseudolysinimonas sp.]|nr:hypothetical protein [Pseudolysinimonas sp.]